MDYLYDNFLPGFQRQIETFFTTIKANFNFDLGPEFEVQVCKFLRTFLPSKYGICRGFVVNENGVKAGDDIIIFDQERFPTLRLLPKDDFSLKEEIPIEAVYAYLEIKHNLTEDTLDKALKQVSNVKKLCSEREKVTRYQVDPYIQSDLKAPYQIKHLPAHRNPIYCAIVSRFTNGSDISEDVNNFLFSQKAKFSNNPNWDFFPEMIIGGPNNFLCTGFIDEELHRIITMFHLPENDWVEYTLTKTPNLGFAICFTHLMAAIDYIRLGKMPWEKILNDGMNEKRHII